MSSRQKITRIVVVSFPLGCMVLVTLLYFSNRRTPVPTSRSFPVPPESVAPIQQVQPHAQVQSVLSNSVKQLAATNSSRNIETALTAFNSGTMTRATWLAFLESLDDPRLLELMRYVCEMDRFAALRIIEADFVPIMRQRWGNNPPYDILLALGKDQQMPMLFRQAVADIVCMSSLASSRENRDLIAATLSELAMNAGEDEQLRSVILKKLSSVIAAGVSNPAKYKDLFVTLASDPRQTTGIRAASVIGAERLNDARIVPILEQICRDYTPETDPTLAKAAVVNLAKFNRLGQVSTSAVDVVRTMMSVATNSVVVGASVYACSFLQGESFANSLPSLIAAKNRITDEMTQTAIYSALSKHPDSILASLNSSDPDLVRVAVEACTVIPLPPAKARLTALLSGSPELARLLEQAIRKASDEEAYAKLIQRNIKADTK